MYYRVLPYIFLSLNARIKFLFVFPLASPTSIVAISSSMSIGTSYHALVDLTVVSNFLLDMPLWKWNRRPHISLLLFIWYSIPLSFISWLNSRFSSSPGLGHIEVNFAEASPIAFKSVVYFACALNLAPPCIACRLPDSGSARLGKSE